MLGMTIKSNAQNLI